MLLPSSDSSASLAHEAAKSVASGLTTLLVVDVSVCQQFGFSTFRFVDVLVVDVSVCRRFA